MKIDFTICPRAERVLAKRSEDEAVASRWMMTLVGAVRFCSEAATRAKVSHCESTPSRRCGALGGQGIRTSFLAQACRAVGQSDPAASA